MGSLNPCLCCSSGRRPFPRPQYRALYLSGISTRLDPSKSHSAFWLAAHPFIWRALSDTLRLCAGETPCSSRLSPPFPAPAAADAAMRHEDKWLRQERKQAAARWNHAQQLAPCGHRRLFSCLHYGESCSSRCRRLKFCSGPCPGEAPSRAGLLQASRHVTMLARGPWSPALCWLCPPTRPGPARCCSLCSLLGSSRQQRLQVLLGAAAVPVLPTSASAWSQLSSNYVFCVGFWGWFCAQFLKVRAGVQGSSARACRLCR
jgi:hypothetical protein